MIDIKRRSEKLNMTDEADIRLKPRDDDTDPLLLKQNYLGKKNYKINITFRKSIQKQVLLKFTRLAA